MTGRDGEAEGDFAVGGRKKVSQLRGSWGWVAIGQVEDESVGEDAGGEAEDGEAVAESFGVDGVVQETPGVLAQIGVEEPEGVFKVTALGLEMVGSQVHSFRPDDPREELHSW